MEVVGDSEAVEDQAEGDEEAAGDEEIEGVLGLRDTSVAAGELDGEHVADLATVVTTTTTR